MTLQQAQADFKAKFTKLHDMMKTKGLDFAVTSGLRSMSDQATLYAQGRTKPGNIVTNAKPGSTPHNYDLAKDVIPVVNGKRTYNVPASWWVTYGQCAKTVGLTWGGSFRTISDKPHVEWSGWRQFRKVN